MDDLPLGRIEALVPKFAVKDLPLGRKLMMTALKSQGQLKRLLSDDSTGDILVSKSLCLNLNFSFINRIRYLLYRVATKLSSRGWVDSVLDPILT